MKKTIKYEENAVILKALGHPVRLRIIELLIDSNGTTVTNLQKIMNLPQSTISQHILKLKLNNIVSGVRKGLEINYRVTNPYAIQIIEIFK